jgi:hypothetical protein
MAGVFPLRRILRHRLIQLRPERHQAGFVEFCVAGRDYGGV